MESPSQPLTKLCTCCKTLKPLSEFGKRRYNSGAIASLPWCYECRRNHDLTTIRRPRGHGKYA